jgi:hypothetical protein
MPSRMTYDSEDIAEGPDMARWNWSGPRRAGNLRVFADPLVPQTSGIDDGVPLTVTLVT